MVFKAIADGRLAGAGARTHEEEDQTFAHSPLKKHGISSAPRFRVGDEEAREKMLIFETSNGRGGWGGSFWVVQERGDLPCLCRRLT